jgi:excisionase family DNA binding protein
MAIQKTLPGYLSTEDVAEHFGVTPYTVREWCKAGELNAAKWGGRWHIPKEELDRFGLPDPCEIAA